MGWWSGTYSSNAQTKKSSQTTATDPTPTNKSGRSLLQGYKKELHRRIMEPAGPVTSKPTRRISASAFLGSQGRRDQIIAGSLAMKFLNEDPGIRSLVPFPVF